VPPLGAPAVLVGAAAVAGLAWRARALTARGAVAATAVGVLVVWGAGLAGGLVLLAFFVSSSVLGRLVRERTASTLDPKGDCRDEWQVLANGGAAAAAAMAARSEPALALWLVTAAFAGAGADTWATIWGGLSRVPPRLLTSGRRVPHGTSGGVTMVGTMGGAAGAAFVALAGAAAGGGPRLAGAATAAGIGGMLADSALGAALQGRFHCSRCNVPSERPLHRCGTPTVHTGGIRWLTNDGVNALATTAALALAFAGWLWLA
jgi:uncharacterized protein (TIGR00297 family)